MTVAVLERRPPSPTSSQAVPGLRLMVLARISCEEGATRPELARELGPFVGVGPAARMPIEIELAQLVRGGLAIESRSRFSASPEGLERLLVELGLKVLPRTWGEMRDTYLVAKTLGLEREPPSRLKGLSRPDVLRAEILIDTYELRLKGTASTTKLRTALALLALERAFGNGIKGDLTSSAGLNAKASRVLAGQLLRKPRDAGTDKRLVAILAAECVGSEKVGADMLRAGILCRLALGKSTPKVKAIASTAPAHPADKPTATDAPNDVVPAGKQSVVPGRHPAASRPDLPGFVKIVQATTARHAEGWPGNRKALVSRVFGAIAAAYPGWGLSLVEFKAMLAECHRIGQLALVTADLKDKRLLDELKQSAIAYKNTVWHLIRVEE